MIKAGRPPMRGRFLFIGSVMSRDPPDWHVPCEVAGTVSTPSLGARRIFHARHPPKIAGFTRMVAEDRNYGTEPARLYRQDERQRHPAAAHLLHRHRMRRVCGGRVGASARPAV